MMLPRRLHRVILLAALLIAAPVGARAQQNEITVTGFPITFPTAGLAAFITGYVDSLSPITFLVDARSGSPGAQRIANVAIRCSTPCPLTSSKAAGDLQWRRADQGTWNSISTANATIEQRSMYRNALNDPWGNDVYWRMLLNYGTDLQGTTITYSLIITLTMTAP